MYPTGVSAASPPTRNSGCRRQGASGARSSVDTPLPPLSPAGPRAGERDKGGVQACAHTPATCGLLGREGEGHKTWFQPETPPLPGGRDPVHLPGVDEQRQEGGEEDSQQDRQNGDDDHGARALGPWGSLQCLS